MSTGIANIAHRAVDFVKSICYRLDGYLQVFTGRLGLLALTLATILQEVVHLGKLSALLILVPRRFELVLGLTCFLG